jgi:7-carboxy-7-deazaguanine synthase
MTSSVFPVMEIFGPTVQGEGMVIGQKTMFVRTAGCDYSCAWCDSAFTWDGSAKDDIRMLTAAEILSELSAVGGDTFSHVTISGGNPALLGNLQELIGLLHEREIKVAIETQGSRWQDDAVSKAAKLNYGN